MPGATDLQHHFTRRGYLAPNLSGGLDPRLYSGVAEDGYTLLRNAAAFDAVTTAPSVGVFARLNSASSSSLYVDPWGRMRVAIFGAAAPAAPGGIITLVPGNFDLVVELAACPPTGFTRPGAGETAVFGIGVHDPANASWEGIGFTDSNGTYGATKITGAYAIDAYTTFAKAAAPLFVSDWSDPCLLRVLRIETSVTFGYSGNGGLTWQIPAAAAVVVDATAAMRLLLLGGWEAALGGSMTLYCAAIHDLRSAETLAVPTLTA